MVREPHFSPLRSGYETVFGPMSGSVDCLTHHDARAVHDLVEGDEEHPKDGYLTDLISRRAAAWVEEVAGSVAGGDARRLESLRADDAAHPAGRRRQPRLVRDGHAPALATRTYSRSTLIG